MNSFLNPAAVYTRGPAPLPANHTRSGDRPPRPSSLIEQVQRRIVELSEDWPRDMPGIAEVASSLGKSPQTLRRQLSAEGRHFKGLKDELRRCFVRELLRCSQASMEEIAELSGFADTSSLFRAVKRWTGTTPAHYRGAGVAFLAE